MLIAKCQILYSLTNSFTRETEIIPQTKTQIQQQAREKNTKEEEKGLYREVEEKIWFWVYLSSTYLAERALQNYMHYACVQERFD